MTTDPAEIEGFARERLQFVKSSELNWDSTGIEKLATAILEIGERLMQTEVQLAGCGAVALGYGGDCKPGDYGYSASLGDVIVLRERLKTYQDNAAKMLARKDKLIEQACEEGIRLQVFLERLTNDFWTGCIDPQSNFALSCKRDDCLQCRLILWRKEKK
jgi:hypothetical protein